MRTFAVTCSAPAEAAWRLLARPDDWATWAPHVRGAWGLGEPEVREGAVGAARLLGALPVPARIVAEAPGAVVDVAGRAWWRWSTASTREATGARWRST